MVAVVGADIGSRNVKLFWGNGFDRFDSTVCGAFELRMTPGVSDMIVGYNDESYFVGPLAVREAFLPLSPKGTDKVHEVTAIRLFAALIKNGIFHVEKLSISQPIENCNAEMGAKMRNLLQGHSKVKMNGIEYTVRIDSVKICPEGAAAYYSLKVKQSNCNIVDFGSGTINLAAIREGRFVTNLSWTVNFGNETKKHTSYDEVAKYIHSSTLAHWDVNTPVYVCGGVSMEVAEALKSYFKDVRIMDDALFANAIGLFCLGSARK